MKRRIVIAIVALLSMRTGHAQSPAGMAGEFLRWGIGGRAMGMGRAFVGQADDATAPYWNPAGLAYLDQFEASIMSTYLFDDISLSDLAIAIPLYREQGLTLGANIISLYAGGIERWKEVGKDIIHDPSEDFSWTETAALASIGFRLIDWHPTLELGLTGKYLHRSLFDLSKKAFGWDWGFRLRPFKYPLFFGTQFQNIGTQKLGEDTFPLVTRVGISWLFVDPFWNNKCILNVDADGIKGIKCEYFDRKIGFEYAITKFSSIRIGLNYKKEQKFEMTLGFGLSCHWLNFDSSIGTSEELGYKGTITPRSAITYRKQENYDAWLDMVKTKYWNSNDKAKYLLIKMIDKDHDGNNALEARILLGDMAFEKGDFQTALDHYLKVIQLKKEDKTSLHELFGEKHVGKDEHSVFSYFNCLESLINQVYPILLKEKIYIPRNFTKKNYYRDILDVVSIIDKYPFEKKKNSRYCFDRTLVLLLQSIIKSGEESIKIASDSLKQFIAACDDSIFTWRKAVALLNYGICLIKQKKFQAAIDTFNVIIQNYKKEFIDDSSNFLGFTDNFIADDAQFLIGECYKNKNSFEKAVIEWAKLRFFYPESDILDLASKRLDSLLATSKISKKPRINEFQLDTVETLNFKVVWHLDHTFTYPFQMIKDDEGNYYISESGKGVVKKFDKEFKAKPLLINKYLIFPTELAIGKRAEQERIYISDIRNNQIWLAYTNVDTTDLFKKGAYDTTLNTSNPKELPFINPSGLAISEDTLLYVVDSGNNRIIKFNGFTGNEIPLNFSFRDNKKFWLPIDVAIDTIYRKLYIADWGNRRVAVCEILNDSTLIMINQLPYPKETNCFWFPTYVTVDYNQNNEKLISSNIYVLYYQEPNREQNFVIKYDSLGQVIGKIAVNKSIFTFFVEKSQNKIFFYVLERKKKGRIWKLQQSK